MTTWEDHKDMLIVAARMKKTNTEVFLELRKSNSFERMKWQEVVQHRIFELTTAHYIQAQKVEVLPLVQLLLVCALAQKYIVFTFPCQKTQQNYETNKCITNNMLIENYRQEEIKT